MHLQKSRSYLTILRLDYLTDLIIISMIVAIIWMAAYLQYLAVYKKKQDFHKAGVDMTEALKKVVEEGNSLKGKIIFEKRSD